VIYERNSFIGEAYKHVGAILEITHRPIKDAIKYIKKDFEIDLVPLNKVKSIIHHSPSKTTVIKGNLGYFFERSDSTFDMKVQIRSQLKSTTILFNEVGDYEALLKQFDYVVIANGEVSFTKELGCFQEWLKTYVKGAIVLGDFDPTSMSVWLDETYCKKGYAYLTPFNSKRASLNLIVTDVNEKEIEEYWELFLSTEGIRYIPVEDYKLNHICGFVYPHRVGNILFAGNAGGAIEPFLGFGVLGSIVGGAMAAKSIVTGEDYEELLQDLVDQNKAFYEFRKVFDTIGNKAYDILITSIGLPGIRQIIYKTPLNVIKTGGAILRFKRKLMNNS